MPTVSFSGLASGIDGDAITNALIEARRLASIPLESKVKKNDDETSALEEFNTKLLTLNDMVKDFLTLAGGAVSKAATSSNEDAVGASATANATSGTTSFEVMNLAKAAIISFDDGFSSVDDPIAPGLSAAATIDITVGSGDAAEVISVTVDSETTLRGLAEAVNGDGSGKVQATYVNTGTENDPNYVFVLNGLHTGVEKGMMQVAVSAELAAQGIFQAPTVSQAENAVLNVTGIGQVNRSGNQISDLIPGLTLQLKQENSGPITISVDNDTDKTAKKLGDLIEAINEVVRYSNENDTIERVEDEKGVTNVFGTLARTRVDDQAIQSIRAALAGASSDVEGSEVNVFADLGVTTERDGTLKFDSGVFMEAVAKDPNAAEDILQGFADKLGTTNGIISEYTRFQGTIDRAIEANSEENESISDRLARLERSLEQQREMMNKIFANLEQTISRLNSDGDALVSMIAGLSPIQGSR